MSILSDLSAALGPIIGGLGADLGISVAIYRATLSSDADGTPKRVYAIDPSWSATNAFFELGSASGGNDTEALQRPHGVRTTAHATLTFVQNASGVLPTVAPFDGFKILSGAFTGYTWLAEADHAMDPIGATGTVRVIAAPAGVIP